MEVHQIGASELEDLLALYKHLHDADDPLPDAATVAKAPADQGRSFP